MKKVITDPTRTRLVALLSAAAALGLLGCDGAGNSWQPGDGGTHGDGGTGCVDEDHDGYGRGCSAGPDCDDTDAFYSDDCPACLAGPAEGCACAGDPPVACYDGPEGTAGVGACAMGQRRCVDSAWTACEGQVLPALGESCNDVDDDCDGEVDEGVDGECSDCDPTCSVVSVGAEGEAPWSPTADNSSGVAVEPESGGLVLDSASVNTYTIWVANSAEGTVSKVDVRTYAELGRYYVGTDPSRTSVNTLGDAYVGLRNGYGVAKVSALGDRCPDRNGDGVVSTSSGHDVLAAGTDECVLWTTPLAGCDLIRGVAAQDEFGPDGEVRSYVWVGSWGGCLWKLDGDTGAILLSTRAPTVVYGLALDGHGNLWSSGQGTALLGRVDTTRCVDDASCAAEPCVGEGTGDACVKQIVAIPTQAYGITVDLRQRVWVGGGASAYGGGPCRYDQTAAPGSRWVCAGVSSYVGGIAADAEGWIWASGTGWAFAVPRVAFRINADDPAQWTSIAGAEGWSNHGAAVDAEGKVWFINYYENCATVIRPGPGLHDNAVETNVSPIFSSPYTYSDMTGSQLRFATAPRGHYRELVPGCDTGETEWGDLNLDLFVPERTQLLVRVRTADDPAALASAPWVVLATVPPDTLPASIGEALERDGVIPGAYLEVELQLSSEIADGTTRVSPVVYDMSVTHRCPAHIT